MKAQKSKRSKKSRTRRKRKTKVPRYYYGILSMSERARLMAGPSRREFLKALEKLGW